MKLTTREAIEGNIALVREEIKRAEEALGDERLEEAAVILFRAGGTAATTITVKDIEDGVLELVLFPEETTTPERTA